MQRVLLIDDDQKLGDLLKSYFEPQGVRIDQTTSGEEGIACLRRDADYDAVFLDVMLPGLQGLEVLTRLRGIPGFGAPIIMLTARGDESDRVAGLELGADDYVSKPFSARELLARLRAVLRRPRISETNTVLRSGDLDVYVSSREVHQSGQAVELTAIEFDILVALMKKKGRVIPRSNLLREAGRDDVTVGERTVDVHVSKLRRKIGDDDAVLIRTVRGVGYVFSGSRES